MSDGAPNEMSNIPAWLQLVLAAVTGASLAAVAMIRLGFSFNNRLQRIENQDLENIIQRSISEDWHSQRAPMLQTRVFADLDKLSDSIAKLSQDVAILIERDRLNQRLEKLISVLNSQAIGTKVPP